MFISNEEKRNINQSIKKTNEALAKALVEITMLTARIKVLEGKRKTEGVIAKKDIADEDRRAKQRMYARKYYAKKKLAQSKPEKKDPNVGS